MFAEPQPGASLLVAFRLKDCVTLIIGSNAVAASRAFAALEAQSSVVVVAHGGIQAACPEIQHRAAQQQLSFLNMDILLPLHSSPEAILDDLLNRFPNISLVCVTNTIKDASFTPSALEFARDFRVACLRHRIPINVSDAPELCSFVLPTTHRFSESASGASTPLQIAVTTNGQGCRLGSRIKRMIVSSLNSAVGSAVTNVGRLRELAKAVNTPTHLKEPLDLPQSFHEDSATPNEPVKPSTGPESEASCLQRRMRWVAQLSEFWPLEHLAQLSELDMRNLLDQKQHRPPEDPPTTLASDSIMEDIPPTSRHLLQLSPLSVKKGYIYLVGAGTGHPLLLTVAARDLLTSKATLVLSDKLVPSSILSIIGKQAQLVIAKKFPGNAEEAQKELISRALEAAGRGEVVVRVSQVNLQFIKLLTSDYKLKQGDPTVYGRVVEEYQMFSKAGFEPIIVPGVTSAITGPTFAGIPITQRGVAESFIVTTGVGKNGKDIMVPGYEQTRTTVILMGVARLPQLLDAFLRVENPQRKGPVFPGYVPIAIVERATMGDQRVIFSTLFNIEAALNQAGVQRPPGMIVIGWSMLAFSGSQTPIIQEDDEEKNFNAFHSEQWLKGQPWKIVEGILAPWHSDDEPIK